MKYLDNYNIPIGYSKPKIRGNNIFIVGTVRKYEYDMIDCFDKNGCYLGKHTSHNTENVFYGMSDYDIRYPRIIFQYDYEFHKVYLKNDEMIQPNYWHIPGEVSKDRAIFEAITNEIYGYDWIGENKFGIRCDYADVMPSLLLKEKVSFYGKYGFYRYVDLRKFKIEAIKKYYITKPSKRFYQLWKHNRRYIDLYFGKNFIEYTDSQINNILIQKLSTHEIN